MGLINLATKFPRYAKVIGMGFKSGRMMNAADDVLMQADKLRVPTIPYANAPAAQIAQASKLESAGVRMINRAKNLDKVSGNYAAFHNFDPTESASLYNDAQKLGQSLNPLLTTAGNIGRPAGRMATAAMMNPVGQMGLYMGLPMVMMAGSGGQQQPESYQEMGAIAPSFTPPASYQDAYAPSYGMPATPQLDEEQIRKARRRAEEQAALNQFYAQALTQYQPYN